MRPKHRNRRLTIIAVCAVFLAAGAYMLMSALKENTQFFYNPSEVLAPGFEPASETIRIGGLVVPGSILKDGELTTYFEIVDFPEDGPANIEIVSDLRVSVTYTGVVPDLFQEGKGVVVGGRMIAAREFAAGEVLAKHDENYQPKK